MPIIRKGKIFPNLTHHHGYRAAQTLTKSTEMKRQYSEIPKIPTQIPFFPGNLWSRQTNNSDSDGACGGWGRGYGSPVAVSDKEISTAPIFSASPHTLQPRNLGSLEVFGGLNVIFEIAAMHHKSYLYSRHILDMFDWYQDYGQSSMFCIPYLSLRQKKAPMCVFLWQRQHYTPVNNY